MAADTITEAVTQDPLKAGVQIASEVLLPLPGGSNLIRGDIRQAVAHAGLGLVARALLGPLGVLLVSANSLSVAMTEKPLVESLNTTGETSQRTTRASQKA